MIPMETIRAMADAIVAGFRPQRIILFGSYATGRATEDSDVDLLVEFEEDPRKSHRGNPIHRLLAERFQVPTDVLIRTSAVVQKHQDNPYTVIYHVVNEGKVLYEKPAG